MFRLRLSAIIFFIPAVFCNVKAVELISPSQNPYSVPGYTIPNHIRWQIMERNRILIDRFRGIDERLKRLEGGKPNVPNTIPRETKPDQPDRLRDSMPAELPIKRAEYVQPILSPEYIYKIYSSSSFGLGIQGNMIVSLGHGGNQRKQLKPGDKILLVNNVSEDPANDNENNPLIDLLKKSPDEATLVIQRGKIKKTIEIKRSPSVVIQKHPIFYPVFNRRENTLDCIGGTSANADVVTSFPDLLDGFNNSLSTTERRIPLPNLAMNWAQDSDSFKTKNLAANIERQYMAIYKQDTIDKLKKLICPEEADNQFSDCSGLTLVHGLRDISDKGSALADYEFVGYKLKSITQPAGTWIQLVAEFVSNNGKTIDLTDSALTTQAGTYKIEQLGSRRTIYCDKNKKLNRELVQIYKLQENNDASSLFVLQTDTTYKNNRNQSSPSQTGF